MDIKKVKNKLHIKFGYQHPDFNKLLAAVRLCPDGRRWDKQNRRWVVPVTYDNLVHLRESGFPVEEEEIKKLDVQIEHGDNLDLSVFEDRGINFYEHQKYGLNILTNNPNIFLFWKMGLGKTLTAIISLEILFDRGEIEKALILCPNCVAKTWYNEFQKFSKLNPINCAGLSAKKRQLALDNFKVCILNYESVPYTDIDDSFDMLILDESHWVKNHQAQRTKKLIRISDGAKRKLLLTGTPVTQGPQDLFTQYRILDGGNTFGQNFWSFQQRYFKNVGYNYPDWQPIPEKEDELQEKMFKIMDKKLKKDCLDLPPKSYQTVYVELTAEQKRLYKQMEKELTAELSSGEIIDTNLAIVKLQKLNQITSGFLYVDGETERKAVEIDHKKLDVLASLIEDKEKVVVWCLFKHDIKTILKKFSYMNPVTTSDWQEFQENPKHRLLVGQVHAGGIGITLTAASYVVYYSQGYSLADRLQNEDRTHRIGTTENVTYIDLVCPDTIDEDIKNIIEMKRANADNLLNSHEGDILSDVLAKFKK